MRMTLHGIWSLALTLNSVLLREITVNTFVMMRLGTELRRANQRKVSQHNSRKLC